MKKIKLATDQVSLEEVNILLRELKLVLVNNLIGDVVEFGCYEGGSAIAMQELIAQYDYSKKLWLYDSFEGLPEKTSQDESIAGDNFVRGSLRASKSKLEKNFFKRGLKTPEIRKVWFYEISEHDLPEAVSLAFLDGDYYESIIDSFNLVWPKLTKGGVVIVDDYYNAALPGVYTALEELNNIHGFDIKVECGMAIINKK